MRLLIVSFWLLLSNLQQMSNTLILQMKGDLWYWGGKDTQLLQKTNWQYNGIPIVSPDNHYVAYKSSASIAVDIIKRNGQVVGGDLPANIWLMVISTGNAERIADQPADAAYRTDNNTDKYIIRSLPAWSPDSQFITWTQLVIDTAVKPQGTVQLVVYDVAQKNSLIIVPELPEQYGVPTALDVRWGKRGIAVWSTTAATDSAGKVQVEDALLLYNRDGKLLNTINIEALYEFEWIINGDTEFLATLSKGPPNQPLDETQWLLVDPESGRIFGMPGTPELYSLSAPDGLSITLSAMEAAPDWEIRQGIMTQFALGTVDDVYAFSHAIAIAPDGQQIAYVQQGAAYLYRDGKTVKIADSDVGAVVWGATGWRVRRKIGG
jgi:hypothetical protein